MYRGTFYLDWKPRRHSRRHAEVTKYISSSFLFASQEEVGERQDAEAKQSVGLATESDHSVVWGRNYPHQSYSDAQLPEGSCDVTA